MKIILADDHTIVREGIRVLLQEAYPFAQVAEADSAESLLALLAEGPWDIVVSDITMPPGSSGLDAIEKIKKTYKVPVIVMTMYAAEDYAVRAMHAGASGYLSKDAASRELVTAINRVMSGKKYVNDEVAAILADSFESGTRDINNLSAREREVFCMLAKAMTVSEIAAELALSSNTVSTFRAHVMQKMNFHNTMELIRYAVDNKLV
ncbi:MAG: response regulator transcription factor [Chitinophagaceae bacterium]|nr:response regulator transcription factor [Chitinophagaceae bacterium]